MMYAPFGCAGFEIAFGMLNKYVVGQETEAGTISLERVLALLTSAPAALLAGSNDEPSASQLGDTALSDFHPRTIPVSQGRIAEGMLADITLIDPEAKWEVDPSQFKSKSRNTPFAGWQAKGRVLLTLCGGRITYSAETIKDTGGGQP
jgi:dihydroorotase